MEKALFIDGNSLLHRAFHALPLLKTSKGIYTNAVYGFTNMLLKILDEQDPDYVAVAFDKKGPTFRHKRYPAYKGTRPKTAEELIGQFDLLKSLLKALNIAYFEVDDYEADDLLGMLSKVAEDQEIFSVLVTGDKDTLQLVSEKTNVLLTRRGITQMELYDLEKVTEEYEILPERVPDLKGLKGDNSDNIPGVPGVGIKTAIKLLKEFDSVENLLENTDKLKGKLKEKIIAYSEQIHDCKYLATIVREPVISIDMTKLKRRDPDNTALLTLLRELEFYTLIERAKKELHLEEITEEIPTTLIETTQEWEKLVKKIRQCKEIGFLIDLDEKKNQINGIALSTLDENFYILGKIFEKNKKTLKEILENEKIVKVSHNSKKIRKILRIYDIDFICGFDTILAAYILEPSKSKYDLTSLYFDYLGKTIDGSDTSKKAAYLIELKEEIKRHLYENNMQDLFFDIEMPLSVVLADMEYEGVKIDIEKLESLSTQFKNQLKKLTKEIYEDAGTEFNINSPKQLGEILFDRLGLPVIKKTKTGYSTDAEVLDKLQSSHPIVEKILEYRFLMKMKSTYADGLLQLVDRKTSRIHSSFNQTVTTTGRISSTEPNLQNIPVKTDIGRHIRGVFIASDSKHVLLSGDYSQIELRVLAHISEDKNLMEAFIKGEDIHTKTASEVFDVLPDEVTPLLRDRAKAVNFGIVYGISDFGLAKNLDIPPKEAKKYIDTYFERYPGVKRYVRDIIRAAKHSGYVTTLLNRRRYIPEISSRNFHRRSFAERVAMNTPIQGSAADIIKIAMVKVYRSLKKNHLKSKLLLQIHDELILDVPEEELQEVMEILKDAMENAIDLKVPLVVDFKYGKTWEQL